MILRFLVAYDGTGFSGYQAQPGQRTVQGVLEDALERLAGQPVRTRVAGRTDAGVHALGQVVSCDLPASVRPETVLPAMAATLPADVSVIDVQTAAPGFDARLGAIWRAYVYLIWNHPSRHPLYHPYSLWVRDAIDVRKLGEALQVVQGTYDFSSFARVRPEQTPVRTVIESVCEDDPPFVRIRVVGDAFLHQMVRSIVGSALEVALGRRSTSWMRQALLAGDRAAAGPVAQPHGLTLTEVGYEGASWPRRVPVGWPWSSSVRTRSEVAGGKW